MKNRSVFGLLLIFLLCYSDAFAQVHQFINQLPKADWSSVEVIDTIPAQDKVKLLRKMASIHKIRFERPDYQIQDPEAERFYPLDTSGLLFVDLNFDDRLDLLYSGQSGWSTLKETRVYLNKNNKLKLLTTLPGGFLDIKKTDYVISIFTIWIPCCDSYTTRIEKHHIDSTGICSYDYSISAIGLRNLRRFPDFQGEVQINKAHLRIMAFEEDFNGTHPYFREKNRKVKKELKESGKVQLIEINEPISFTIFSTRTEQNRTYQLIITEHLQNVPKSLFEWSDGDNRRLVGWHEVK